MTKFTDSALRLARSLVGGVSRVNSGPTGWGYNTWDERAKAWRITSGMTHQQAQQSCAQYTAVTAYILLAEKVDDELSLYEADAQGSAQQRLATLLRLYPIEGFTP